MSGYGGPIEGTELFTFVCFVTRSEIVWSSLAAQQGSWARCPSIPVTFVCLLSALPAVDLQRDRARLWVEELQRCPTCMFLPSAPSLEKSAHITVSYFEVHKRGFV